VAEDENQIVNVEVPVAWESQKKPDASPDSKRQVETNKEKNNLPNQEKKLKLGAA